MSLTNKEIFEFGNFRLDVSERMLTNGRSKRVAISDRAFDTLCALVKNAGHLMKKSELMEVVWHDSFVEENNLDKCVHAIRRVLKEKPGEQKFIETVRGHGYRFVGLVNKAVDGSDNPDVASRSFLDVPIDPRASDLDCDGRQRLSRNSVRKEPELFGEHRRIRWYRLLAVLLGVFAIMVSAAVFYSYRSEGTNTVQSGIKVAVLPLTPIDSGNRVELYEVGIADALINKVNSMNGVFARPLNSIRKYAFPDQEPLNAGAEQRVDFVVVSNYRVSEGKLRVSWQLVEVATGTFEQARIAESNAESMLTRQDEIVADIGAWLVRRFATSFAGEAAARGTNNEEAYRLYLEGMYLYDRRTSADSQRAVEKFAEAIRLDPNYALAWAGKAHAHRSLGNFGGSLTPHDQYRQSMAAVEKALSLDNNLSNAHSALCENKFFYEYDYYGAERECKRAIALDPNSYLAHEIYARCLWTLQRFDEGIAEAELAVDLQPKSLFSQRNYAITLYYAGRVDEAVREFKRVSDMDQTFVANYAWFIPAMLVQGSHDEAFGWFVKWQSQMNVDENGLKEYRRAYEADGWQGVGQERLKRFDEDKIRSYFLEACLVAHTGNKDKTFEYLERSFERREWGIPFLRIDPSLSSIRSDPRYAELVQRVEAIRNSHTRPASF